MIRIFILIFSFAISVAAFAQKSADSTNNKINEVHANADEIKAVVLRRHIVQQGETLTKIAQKYKVTVEDLTKWNALRATTIRVGEELVITRGGTIQPFEAWNKPSAARIKNLKINIPPIATDLLVVISFRPKRNFVFRILPCLSARSFRLPIWKTANNF